MELEHWLFIISIIIAFFAIVFSYINALQVKKAMWAEIIIELRKIYASDEMLKGMHNVQAWKHKYKDKFVEKFAEFRKTENEAKEVDQGRRIFSHYIVTIYELKKKNTVNKKFVKLLIDRGTVEFLKDYIVPLQKKLPYYTDGKEIYKFYYELYNFDINNL